MNSPINQSAFQIANARTVELILPDGFVRGAYQAGVISVLIPHILRQGAKIKHISSRSIGAVNGLLLTGLLNSNQPEKISDLLEDVWKDMGKLGDTPLLPLRALHRITDLTACFNQSASNCSFPNMPLGIQYYFSKIAAGHLPLNKMGNVLKRYMDDEMWNGVHSGYTELMVRAAKNVPGINNLKAFDMKRENIDLDSIKSSCAAHVFGTYNNLSDGTYVRKSLYPTKPRTDIILSIPCTPANPIANKREQQAETDRTRLFNDQSVLLQRVTVPTTNANESSRYNFTSRHTQWGFKLGQETAYKLIEEHGDRLLHSQFDDLPFAVTKQRKTAYPSSCGVASYSSLSHL